MKVGAYLLEKHNFGDPEVKARFLDQFGYSETILEGILSDRYPVLLGCHIYDIATFTGEDPDFIHSLEEFDQLTDFQKQTVTPPPMGKPFVTHPVITEVHIKDLTPDDKLFKGPAYVTPVEELEQTFSIGNPPKQPGVFIELNLNNDKPVELVPVTPEGIMRYEQEMNRLRRSMQDHLSINPSNDPELDALYERVKARANGKHFKVITPKALQPGDAINKDPAEIDYLVTTYPITGIESVKIVKGRELGIGTGDKFVFSNQMRSTIGRLGLDIPAEAHIDVMLSNKHIAALMEDPEFAKEFRGMSIDTIARILKDRAFSEKFGEHIHNPDKPLKGTVTLPPGALEGIDIYTQPSVPGLVLPEPELPIGLSGTITLDMSGVTMGNARTGVETKVVVDKGTVDKFNIYQAVVNDIKDKNPINKLKDQELIPVPKSLLRELANVAIDNGYPCADEIFEILSKHK